MSSEPRVIVYQPQPGFQTEIHRRKEDIITIGGAKFPGKTHGMIGDSLRQINHPKYHAIFFRRTYKRLQEILDRQRDMYPQLGARFVADEHRWRFPSGAKIEISHLENEEDKRDHQGKEYTVEYWDQLEEFTETQFDFVLASCRSKAPDLDCYVMASHNPGGTGHAWVNRRFVSGKVPGQTYTETWDLPGIGKVSRTSVFIRGIIFENKIGMANNPQYLATLAGLPDKMRKALLYGDYDVLEGQYFDTWNSALHVVKPFAIPDHWRMYGSMDWGRAKPLSFGLWAVPPEMDHVYRVWEYYRAGKNSDEAAEEIYLSLGQRFGRQWIVNRKLWCVYADPSIWGKDDKGKSIADEFTAQWRERSDSGQWTQLPLVPASNDRMAGWNLMHKMLAIQPDGKPYAMWFENCRDSARTIPSLIHDENHPEDLDTDGEDHAADDARYFFISRFGSDPIKPEKPYAKLTDQGSKDEWERVAKMREDERRKTPMDVLAQVGT